MTDPAPPPDLRLRWALLLLVLAVLGGALLRVPGLESGPPGFHSDEAFYALDAVRILEGARPVFLEDNNGRQALFSWSMAPLVGLLGNETGPARLTSALWGLLLLPAIFLLVREALAGRPWRNLAAALTVLLLAVLFYHVFYSRVAFRVITYPTLLALACGALLWALRSDGWWRWALAGLLAGLTIHTYVPGYATLPLLLLVAVPAAWVRRGWRPALTGAAVFSLAWFVVAAPLLWYFATAQDSLVARPAQVTITAIATGPLDLLRILGENTLAYLGMFAIAGDTRPLNNIPGAPALDPFTLGMVLAGLAGLALGRLRGDATWLTVVLLPAMLLPGILTWENLPHAFRVLGVLVPLALVLAAGWSLAAGVLAQVLGPRTPALLAASGAVVALAIGSATAVRYWVTWVPDPRVQQDYSSQEVAFARGLRDAPGAVAFAGLPPQGQALFRYLAPAAIPAITWLQEGDSLPPGSLPPGRPLVLFRTAVPLAPGVIAAPGTPLPSRPGGALAEVVPAPDLAGIPALATWPDGSAIASLAATRLDPGGSLGAGWTWQAPPPAGEDTWLQLVLLDPGGAPAAARAVRLDPQQAGAFTWHELFFDPVLPPGSYRLWMGLGRDQGAADLTPEVSGSVAADGPLLLAGEVTIQPDTFPQTGPPVAMDPPLQDASLGGMTIAGSRAPTGQLLPGTTATLPVYLRRTGTTPPGPLTVEVRQDGQTLASAPWQPFAGRFPFSNWTPFRLYRDTLAVPIPRGATGSLDLVVRDDAGAAVLLRRLEPAQRSVTTSLPAERGRQLDVASDAGIVLAGAAIGGSPATTVTARAGQPLEVLLTWQAVDAPRATLRQFLHLRDARGETVAQVDRLPLDGALPTTTWVAGEVVQDRLVLDTAGLAPGTYTLVAGLSDLDQGRRSPLTPGNPDGTTTLATIVLAP